jgi:hypothetical protein
MKAVMGLLDHGEALERAIGELQAAGFSGEQVDVLEDTHDVWLRMDCSTKRSVVRDAAIGAGLVGLIYVTFGVAAAISGVANDVPATWCTGAAAVFLLIGLGLGAFWGAFIGRAEAEKETHLYLEGVRTGRVLVLVWVEDARTSQAQRILRQANALGVRICGRARQAPKQEAATPIQPAH